MLSHTLFKRWNGRFFERVALRDLGLIIQLGHLGGDRCLGPVPAPRDFVVIHTNGLHPANIQYCQCSKSYLSGTRLQQLLRMKLYPSTIADPTTCCTFDTLKTFHTITLQSKITVFDYYSSLEKLTDNTGLGVRYVSVYAIMSISYHLTVICVGSSQVLHAYCS